MFLWYFDLNFLTIRINFHLFQLLSSRNFFMNPSTDWPRYISNLNTFAEQPLIQHTSSDAGPQTKHTWSEIREENITKDLRSFIWEKSHWDEHAFQQLHTKDLAQIFNGLDQTVEKGKTNQKTVFHALSGNFCLGDEGKKNGKWALDTKHHFH